MSYLAQVGRSTTFRAVFPFDCSIRTSNERERTLLRVNFSWRTGINGSKVKRIRERFVSGCKQAVVAIVVATALSFSPGVCQVHETRRSD